VDFELNAAGSGVRVTVATVGVPVGSNNIYVDQLGDYKDIDHLFI
jgi:hypothetical protein